MKLLLTGGTGFFGKALLRHWQQQPPGWDICLLSRDPERFRAAEPALCRLPGLRLLRGDITDPASLPQGKRFTHVLHAAADSTLGPQLTPLQRYDQIVTGTRHLLDFAVASGARRFLLTSSGAVYGRLKGSTGVGEDCQQMPDPLVAGHAYGVAKRAAEHLCALYRDAHGLETVVARCFAFVGPDLPLGVHFAIGNFIRDALGAEAITVQGDGLPLRSYMHQDDLALWLTALLERGAAGEAYNVGSPLALSVGELAHRVRDLLAPGKPVHVLGRGDPSAQRHAYLPDVSKAESLGLRLHWSLDEAILDTARHAPRPPS